MHNFNNYYIQLLREQAEDEIKYLKSVGHSHGLIDHPCIFCYEARRTPGESRTNGDYANKYKCNRLLQLENFLSELHVRERTQGNSVIRRPIGQEVKNNLKAIESHTIELLPAMPVNLKF